jgi:hypothetical protein
MKLSESNNGHGAWSMEHGAWEGRALRNDPVGHFSEGACLQGRLGAGLKEKGERRKEKGERRKEKGERRKGCQLISDATY